MALGNYHNCGPKEKIEAEYVSYSDVQAMVHLCARIAADRGKKNHAVKALKKKLKSEFGSVQEDAEGEEAGAAEVRLLCCSGRALPSLTQSLQIFRE